MFLGFGSFMRNVGPPMTLFRLRGGGSGDTSEVQRASLGSPDPRFPSVPPPHDPDTHRGPVFRARSLDAPYPIIHLTPGIFGQGVLGLGHSSEISGNPPFFGAIERNRVRYSKTASPMY